MDSRRFFARVP